MTLKGGKRSTGEKPVAASLRPPQIPRGLAWNRTQASAGKTNMTSIVNPYRAVNTLHLDYKNQPVNAVQ